MSQIKFKLLVIDDDTLIHQTIKLCAKDWHVESATKLDRNLLNYNYHAAFVDMHLTSDSNKKEGLQVIKTLSERYPQLEIIAISGDLNRELMEACLKAGAQRFLAKPLTPTEVQLTLQKIEAHFFLQDAQQRNSSHTATWIGNSKPSKTVLQQIASLKGENGPILIEGESGTGKEVVAQILKEQNEGAPFLSINVAALPENLFESELFGHIKGAFTGADQNKMGLAEAAHGGDLFLDEIEALPLTQQVKLLRFLETGEIRKVGDKENKKVNVRLIIATNQNLEKMVRESKFREDLLFRLNGKKILLPPLRERKEDIELLAQNFLQKEKPKRNKQLTQDALEALQNYDWPGNVRELKRVLEQVSLLSPLPIIRAEDVYQITKPSLKSANGGSVDLSKGLEHLLQEQERMIILKALEMDQDIDNTARLLGISRSSLYKKIKDLQIEV